MLKEIARQKRHTSFRTMGVSNKASSKKWNALCGENPLGTTDVSFCASSPSSSTSFTQWLAANITPPTDFKELAEKKEDKTHCWLSKSFQFTLFENKVEGCPIVAHTFATALYQYQSLLAVWLICCLASLLGQGGLDWLGWRRVKRGIKAWDGESSNMRNTAIQQFRLAAPWCNTECQHRTVQFKLKSITN